MQERSKEHLDYEKQVNTLKEALRKARDLRSRALTQKEFLEQQQEKLCQKAQEYGVKPEELTEKITELKKELDGLLAKAHELIPWELLKKEK